MLLRRTIISLAVMTGGILLSVNACTTSQSSPGELARPAVASTSGRHVVSPLEPWAPESIQTDTAAQDLYTTSGAASVQSIWKGDLFSKDRFQMNLKPTAEERKIAKTYARSYLKNLEKGEHFVHYLLSELKKKNLPVELAVIPMIESGFNPRAVSPSGARGVWQYMRVTSKSLGLKQHGNYDEIYDFVKTTDVSLTYFKHLYEVLDHDWDLVAAAYNQGEYGVLRAVKAAKARGVKNIRYDNIGISNYAKTYVRHFHAYADLLRHPEAYGITPPEIKNRPAFRRVEVAGRVHSMQKASELAGVDLALLQRLNAGYLSDDLRHASGTHGLLVPVENASKLEQALRSSAPRTASNIRNGRR